MRQIYAVFKREMGVYFRSPIAYAISFALLLNLVHLEPGEAIYMEAGHLHAYLSGVGIEIMASSDNVLRGGLTPKHVDVDELLRVLIFVDGPVRPRPLTTFSRSSAARDESTERIARRRMRFGSFCV